MYTDLTKLRNIGISAHIDSGKTTLTERVLFYTKRIHAIHEVKGKDGVGATMDSMDLERERGITIQSAATHCQWKGMNINIIDTPGHVDFTIEVERALRVLDGAILVLDSVAGVQSQTLTVDRQMRRYKVPRLVFVNKCDRQGANPIRAMEMVRDKLGLNAVMLQVPVGLEDKHEGVVDLVTMRCHRFSGANGENITDEEIPADLLPLAKEHREKLLDAASLFSDELMEAVLEERATPEMIRAAVRKGTIALQLVPVFLGSAYKNKAVQKLLDGVIDYLPEPTQVENEILDLDKDEARSVLPCDIKGPLVMLAFKLEDGRYGQLTYMRIYSGALRKDDFITNTRTGKKVKVGRLVRMHADQMEDIPDAGAGDIVATFGIDCNTGETFTDGNVNYSMTSMHVPAAVISYSIKPKDSKSENNLSKALRRFSKEDPTFRVHMDEESSETIISGMGELHLDVYIERMKREYSVEVIPSPPRVAYRETITQRVEYNYTHKKQTGGSGQYGNVAGWIEPHPEGKDFEFVDEVVGGAVPRQFIPSVEKGFKSMLDKGRLIGAPVVGVLAGLNDGKSHAVDSSDIAFQEAARGAWREAYDKAKPKILEPIMKVVVEGPSEFSGAILGTINQRRGMIVGSMDEGNHTKVEAEVPLSEMFGYSTVIRSSTQGKAEFTMEFAKYAQVPSSVGEELIKKYQEEIEKKKK